MKNGRESKAFLELSRTATSLENDSIRACKAQSGRVVGYFCSSMPEEILTAAGLFPFRMRATGNTSTEMSDAYLSSINCSFVRHSLDAALSGRLAFLDGVIVLNSCDNIRRVYDHWVRRMDTPFVQIMSLPRKAGDAQVEWFRAELVNLKGALEAHFRVDIADDDLREAIRLHNETRRLQRRLYEMRKGPQPPITGAETLAVTVAGTAMPKKEYNALLEQLLEDLGQAGSPQDYRARLMIMGGELDDPAYLEVIEDQGGLVVTDSLCFGTRMFWRDVEEETKDPLEALARFYVAVRPSCPRLFGEYEKRSGLVKEMIRDFQVDGVILERLAFCDLWGFEQYTIKNDFADWNVPLLMLDREYTLSGVGQLRTRVQAFLETIGGRAHGSQG